MNLLRRKSIFLLICLVSCTGLIVSCGKKPTNLKAPPHVTQDPYPQTYPVKDPAPGI